jgi:lipid-binding SYLF domain-containing protein
MAGKPVWMAASLWLPCAGGDVDTNTIKDPVIGFIFSNKGLMYNLIFEGSKITRLDK